MTTLQLGFKRDKDKPKLKALSVAVSVEEVLQALKPNSFTFEIFEDKEMVEINIEEFEILDTKEGFSKKDEVTVFKSEAIKGMTEVMCIRNNIHTAVEFLLEVWLKYGITTMKSCYKDGQFYYEFASGFRDPKKFWDSLEGWDTDKNLMWERSFIVEDEVHRVGGRK